MTSFKGTRYSVLLSYDQGILNDEEPLVWHELYNSPSLNLPYNSYPLFDLDDMENDEYLAKFRVKKRDCFSLEHSCCVNNAEDRMHGRG